MSCSTYVPLCNALVLLFKPLVEIVIHDLKSNTISYIVGNLSQRKMGDPSLLDIDDLDESLDKIIYPKLNVDGRLIKSISVPVDQQWLICINCDVSLFAQMQQVSEIFLQHEQSIMPSSLFKNDWQEKLHQVIHAFLKEQNWHFDHLNKKQKIEIVFYLFQEGALTEKNAADYIANALGLGRATIFNYLRRWRQDEDHPI